MVEEPTFAEISDALLELVRHDARMNEIAEPFMAGLPQEARGVIDAHAQWRRRMVLLAHGQRLLVLMAPREAEHRALIAAPVQQQPASHGGI